MHSSLCIKKPYFWLSHIDCCNNQDNSLLWIKPQMKCTDWLAGMIRTSALWTLYVLRFLNKSGNSIVSLDAANAKWLPKGSRWFLHIDRLPMVKHQNMETHLLTSNIWIKKDAQYRQNMNNRSNICMSFFHSTLYENKKNYQIFNWQDFINVLCSCFG